MRVMIRIPGTKLADAQAQILKAALEHCGWDRDKAAKMLDCPRSRFKDIRAAGHNTQKAKSESARQHVRKGAWVQLVPTAEDA